MTLSTIVIGIVVLAAVLYFVRHIVGLFKGTASCCGGGGGCSGCSACQPKSSKTVVHDECGKSSGHV